MVIKMEPFDSSQTTSY